MSSTNRLDSIGSRFTAIVIGAMQVLLMIVIAVAVLELFWLFFTGASDWLRNVDSVPDLQFDFEHTDGFVLVGIGTLVISLTAGYFLVRWGTLSNSLQRQRHAHQAA